MSYLCLEGVTKKFGEVVANDAINLVIAKGSVHAILGENGAGKTTLMNILFGLHQPDDGRIRIDGNVVEITSPRVAQNLRIGMIHQHFALVKPLTVMENIVLGLKGSQFFLNLKYHARRIADLSQSYGLDIDLNAPVWKLPVGMQQRIEILKALYRKADILILDEPTSVLTPTEVAAFFKVLEALKADGKTILFITHKLAEVMAIADRVSVLRSGRVVCDLPVSEATPDELVRHMTGRQVIRVATRNGAPAKAILLSVENLIARNDRGQVALNGVSVDVRRGEIVGIAGVNGNGQTELAEVLAGLRQQDSGRVAIDDVDVSAKTARQRKHELGVGYVPGDRQGVSLLLNQSIARNCVLRNFDRPSFSSRGILDVRKIHEHTRGVVEKYDVRPRDIHQSVRYLSGGNQQKLVVGRELEDAPRLLIIDQPCQGLDIGAVGFVHRTLAEQRRRGCAVLYISTELEDLLSTCDRIAVMYRGQIKKIVFAGDATSEQIGRLMAGLEDAA